MTVTTVRQILDQKGTGVYSVPPGASIFDALKAMAEHDVGAVLVIEKDRLAGIFTERDYARRVALKGLTSKDATVGELMTPNVCTVTPSQTVEDIMSIMTDNRFRHLPVVERGQIVGIVSIGDIVKSIIVQQEVTISHLSNYIAGDIAT